MDFSEIISKLQLGLNPSVTMDMFLVCDKIPESLQTMSESKQHRCSAHDLGKFEI